MKRWIAATAAVICLGGTNAHAQVRGLPDARMVLPVTKISQSFEVSDWDNWSTEQRLGIFLQIFWLDRHLMDVRCQGQSGNYKDQKACLVRNGFGFETTSPQKCYLTITEQLPPRDQPTKSWDGKVTSVDIIGRELTIALAGLDEDLIRRNLTQFQLYVEISDQTPTKQRIRLSSNPNEWIELPAPPTLTDSRPGNEVGNRELTRRWLEWRADQKRYGDINIPGFEIASYSSMPGTDLEADLKRLRDNRNRMFLKISSAYFSHAFRREGAASRMTDVFVEIVKSILAECKR